MDQNKANIFEKDNADLLSGVAKKKKKKKKNYTYFMNQTLVNTLNGYAHHNEFVVSALVENLLKNHLQEAGMWDPEADAPTDQAKEYINAWAAESMKPEDYEELKKDLDI